MDDLLSVAVLRPFTQSFVRLNDSRAPSNKRSIEVDPADPFVDVCVRSVSERWNAERRESPGDD